MKEPRDKRMSLDEVVGELRSGMTIGIGGWGPRRKPMALVRAILRSDLKDLTLVSYGGADVGLLAQAGRLKRLVYAFVSLDTVPLELEFTGDFFHLADFFHQVKRFVHVVNGNVVVNGRLVTIQTVNYTSSADLFPKIKAQMTATVYLAPKAEGATAGATPAGPAAPTTTPASAPAPSSTPAPPTAAATP